MITDIQGWVKNNRIILSGKVLIIHEIYVSYDWDPAIHSINIFIQIVKLQFWDKASPGTYGGTDLGDKGMQAFLKNFINQQLGNK